VILKRDKAARRRFLVQIIENRVILRQMISGEKQARANTGLIHTIFMRITHNICCSLTKAMSGKAHPATYLSSSFFFFQYLILSREAMMMQSCERFSQCVVPLFWGRRSSMMNTTAPTATMILMILKMSSFFIAILLFGRVRFVAGMQHRSCCFPLSVNYCTPGRRKSKGHRTGKTAQIKNMTYLSHGGQVCHRT